jgi:hypothetical protein
MDNDSLIVFLVCAFVAEVIGTMTGFGAATVLTPIASFFLDIKTAVAVVACFHLFGNASRLFFFGRHIHWSIVGRFGVIGVVLSFVGAHLAAWLSADQIRMALGGFLVIYGVAEALRVTSIRIPATTPALLTGGVFSGVIAGLIGTGGAIRSACLLAFGLPKEAYLGTSAAIALLVDATRLPVYLTQQFIPSMIMPVIWGLTVIAFSGSFVGQWLVRRVSQVWFKRFVLAMTLVMGVKLVIDGVRGVAG